MFRFIFVLFIVTASFSANALFKCTVEGKVKYQSAPCQDGSTQAVLDDNTPPDNQKNIKKDVGMEISQIEEDDPETLAMEKECTQAQGTEKLIACTRLQERLKNKANQLREIQAREEALAEQSRQQLRDLEKAHQDRLRTLDRLR